MIKNYLVLPCLPLLFFPFFTVHKKLPIHEPEKDDVRSVDFDIIGKLNNNYLVYKARSSAYSISVYDNDMKLIDKVKMDFLPDKLINYRYYCLQRFFLFYLSIPEKKYCLLQGGTH